MAKALVRRRRGATALTYGLVVGLVAVGSLSAVNSVGDSVVSLFGTVSDDMLLVPDTDIQVSIDGTPEAMDISDSARASGPVTVTLSNGGRDATPSLSAALSNTADFELVADDCTGKPLAREGRCAVTVRAVRDVTGSYTGQLTITGAGVQIALAGTATIPELYAFTSHTFSTCGRSGTTGPSLSQCRSAYSTDWDENGSYFSVSNGIQLWTVPATGTYRITAVGARGGNAQNGTGGRGTSMRGDFSLTEGEQLKILVGQRGADHTSENCDTGGGGGTFVTRSNNSALIIAGGGGGATSNSYGANGVNASTGTSGTASLSCGRIRGSGGSGGSGGRSSSDGSNLSAAGGGLTGNGENSGNSGWNLPGGRSFTNGGAGGASPHNANAHGGFGGGGAGHGSCRAGAGGGGGYSGGGGSEDCGGGGGGSFNGGSNPSNSAGSGTGHGSVTIQRL